MSGNGRSRLSNLTKPVVLKCCLHNRNCQGLSKSGPRWSPGKFCFESYCLKLNHGFFIQGFQETHKRQLQNFGNYKKSCVVPKLCLSVFFWGRNLQFIYDAKQKSPFEEYMNCWACWCWLVVWPKESHIASLRVNFPICKLVVVFLNFTSLLKRSKREEHKYTYHYARKA